MPVCPVCSGRFESGEQFCPKDGVSLRPDADGDSLVGGDKFLGRMIGGRYRVEKKLGQGGMGAVYRAIHVLMDKAVAIKVLRTELAADGEAAARFHREARSASRLDQEYCIRVTDFGRSDDGVLYLVMELLDGQSLGREARRGPVAPGRAAAIALAVAEALQHAHENGVIHRDLKPDNVFMARRGRQRELVKVLDFGLAKLVTEGQPGTSITRDGTVFGTPEYMAPEQAEGESLDGRTDIYALGVILYQMLTGDVPFAASNFVALLTKQVSEKPRPLADKKPGLVIPPGLEAVVMRCLEKKPARRYATAGELADALWPFVDEAALAGLSLPTRQTSGTTGDRAADATPSAAMRLGTPQTGVSTVGSSTGTTGTDSVAPIAVDSIADQFVGRPVRRRLLAGLTLLVLLAGGGLWWWRGHRITTPVATVTPVAADQALAKARSQIAAGALDEAKQMLDSMPASAAAELLRSAIAEQNGERLNALGHLHTATRLAPNDAEPRAQLASLLARLGHTPDACREARRAIAIDPGGTRSAPARAVLAHHRCKE